MMPPLSGEGRRPPPGLASGDDHVGVGEHGQDPRLTRVWRLPRPAEDRRNVSALSFKFVRAIWLRDHGRRLAEFAILWPGRGVDGGETPDRGLMPRKWPPNPVR
jgi:hypothetical protein